MLTSAALRRVLVALAATGLLLSGIGAASAGRPLPENDTHAKPNDDQGYLLGYPSPTYAWHGCHKTSSVVTPAPQEAEIPEQPSKGNAQGKVTWTVTDSTTAGSRYVVSWKVADGWKICGVEAAVLGTDPAATTDVGMQIGYTSKGTKGSTVTSGYETIKVKVTKQDTQDLGIPASFAGNFSIAKIYGLTAYVKKAKKN